MDARRAGFSLLELLIAAALFAVVALGAFEGLRELLAQTTRLAGMHADAAALERLVAQWRSEALSATAVWAGASAAGSVPGGCVELDYYTADSSGPSFWAYRRYPNHPASDAVPPDAVERVAARGPFAACDAAISGPLVARNVATFSLWSSAPAFTSTGAAALIAHADPYLGTADSPFLGAAVPDTPAVSLGVLTAANDPSHPLSGGNAIVEARIDDEALSRVADLAAGVVPTGYTAVLDYTCDARCAVGRAGTGPQTLTGCTVSWVTAPGWPVPVYAYPAGSGVVARQVAGYLWGGWFVFAYADPLFGTGDTNEKWLAATTATAVSASAPDPTPATWFADLANALPAAQSAAIATELSTCAQLDALAANDYYRN